jgi:hypothetical protein
MKMAADSAAIVPDISIYFRFLLLYNRGLAKALGSPVPVGS